MTGEFDPKKSYLTLKAHEKMIAYASFRFQHDGKNGGREGVIKISSFHRPYGGGQLTLTFIIDTEGDEALRHQLDELFNNILCIFTNKFEVFIEVLGQSNKIKQNNY